MSHCEIHTGFLFYISFGGYLFTILVQGFIFSESMRVMEIPTTKDRLTPYLDLLLLNLISFSTEMWAYNNELLSTPSSLRCIIPVL